MRAFGTLPRTEVWRYLVEGSRRYRKFDTYLIEPSIWAQHKERLLAQAEQSLDCESYLNGRKQLLDQELHKGCSAFSFSLPESRKRQPTCSNTV